MHSNINTQYIGTYLHGSLCLWYFRLANCFTNNNININNHDSWSSSRCYWEDIWTIIVTIYSIVRHQTVRISWWYGFIRGETIFAVLAKQNLKFTPLYIMFIMQVSHHKWAYIESEKIHILYGVFYECS